MKSTIGNITLIDRFRKKHDEAEISPEEQIFGFWMEYFVEAIREEVGDMIRFPVCVFIILILLLFTQTYLFNSVL